MAITKVVMESARVEVEQIYEKEIPQPSRKERFTISQLDSQIEQHQAQIDALLAKKAEALAIKEEIK